MPRVVPFRSALLACGLLFSGLFTGASLSAQDPGQMGFSDLQSRANELASRGRLIDAMPFLKELVDRVEKADDKDIRLDFPLFLIGTGHVQAFVQTGSESELSEALNWYDKLEEEYPQSSRLKDAMLKKVDVLRILGKSNEAAKLIRKMLEGGYSFRLSYSEQTKLLRDLTQTYYGTGKLKEGLPFFQQLLNTSRDTQDRALAAAASFEAYFQAGRVEEALELLPLLARDAEVRYRPRLNVAFLKASDQLDKQERYTDAALILSLIKTTDTMIGYYENKLSRKESQLEQREAFGGAEDEVERLKQEIKGVKENLKALRDLPKLRNELLVRRARNFTKTGRRYEAFWMFFDLMEANPDHKRIQFYTYASFSNAMRINKRATAIEIGREYRSDFPEGEYYSDVSVALAGLYQETGQGEKMLALAKDFLTRRPRDAQSPTLLRQWAGYLMERQRFDEIITQIDKWLDIHRNPVFEHGLYYWKGFALLQTAAYTDAIAAFSTLLERFPTSVYAEDALLRKGVAQFYNQSFEPARETLNAYLDKHPDGDSIDQAHFFLGEIANLNQNYEVALERFQKADSLTTSQQLHDTAAMRIGSVYEAMERYADMADHFEAYIDRFGEDGRLTEAIHQLGRAYEFQMRPVATLKLYRENIEKYADDPTNTGVDTLIESYAEKYDKNEAMLERTVEFLDRLEEDKEFRKKIVTDRGFLFEHFYENDNIDQRLYNEFRNHPEFGPGLMEGLAPVEELISPYRDQLAKYPSESPADFYRRLLAKYRGTGDYFAEVRMLMGLYRVGMTREPSEPFDKAFLDEATPRVLLYVADYSREDRLEFAVMAWEKVVAEYANTDSAIVAYMRLADVSARRGERQKAIDYLRSIRDQFPGTPKLPAVILRQGELLTAMGRTDEAREEYQYILQVPEWRGEFHARALLQTGRAFMKDGQPDKAHGFFERTFLAYSHFGEWAGQAYLADAEALVEMGAPQDAASTLREALEKVADSAPEELLQSIRDKLNGLSS